MAEVASPAEQERVRPEERPAGEPERTTEDGGVGAIPLQATIGNAALARAGEGGPPSPAEPPEPTEPAERTVPPAPAGPPAPPAGPPAAPAAAPAAGPPAAVEAPAPPEAPAPAAALGAPALPAMPVREYDFRLPRGLLAEERLSVPRRLARRPGYDRNRARSDARSLTFALRATGAGIEASMRGRAEARKAELTSLAESARAAIVADVRARLTVVCNEVASAKASVAAAEANYSKQAFDAIDAGPKRLEEATTTGLAALDGVATDRIGRAETAVTSAETKARELGTSEGRRGKAAIDGQAVEAWRMGEAKAAGYPADEEGDVQRDAALKVAAEAAAKIAEPGPELQEKLEEAGETLGDGFDDADSKVVETIESQSASLREALTEQGAALAPQFDLIRADVMAGMTDTAGQGAMGLAGVEASAKSEFAALEAGLTGHLDLAIAATLELIDVETDAVATATQALVTETADAVEALENPAPEPVKATLAAAESAAALADENFAEGLDDMGRSVERTFADGQLAALGAVAGIESGVSSGLAEAAGKVDEGLGMLATQAARSVDKVLEEWTLALADAKTSAERAYDDLIAGMQKEVDRTLEQGRVDMVKQVDQAVAKNREGLAPLEGKMEEAAREAKRKYNEPWYKKLGRWLLNAVWSFVKGLLILIAVVVLAVLAIVLIVVGIIKGAIVLLVIGLALLAGVVVFAIYSIVSGIVARVRSANTWWQGVWGVVVGVLDIVGLPNLVEGIIQHDIVNGRRLTVEEAGERFGSGFLNALTFFLPLKLKGAKARVAPELPRAPEIPRAPELPPAPEAPRVPELPPEVPRAPEVPPTPEAARVPEAPEVPRRVEERVEEPPARVEEPPARVEEPPKPPEEAPRRPEEAPRPPEEAPRPPEEAPRPPEEAPKPPEEAPKPPEEAPKPPEEAPKPPEEPTRPPEEGPAPSEQALDRARAEKAANDARIAELQKQIDALTRRINDILDRRTRARGKERTDLGRQADKASKRRAELEKARSEVGRRNDALNKEIGRLERRINPDKRVELPCFSADTTVWTPSGPTRIDALAAGDRVLTCDIERGSTGGRNVEAVLHNSTTRFHEIEVAGETILATGDHRFWVEPLREWVAARDLAPGMLLRLADGSCSPVDRRARGKPGEYPTFNLRIEGTPTYFVGPGVLVHNDGGVTYDYGGYSVYEGFNPDFPDSIYIGETDDIKGREKEHRTKARQELKKKLTPEQRRFWEFMKGVKLRPRASGLTQAQAFYLEYMNIQIEIADGRWKVMNRLIQTVRKIRLQKLRTEIIKQLGGKCPP
jgi:Pretoxin HINT domain